MKFDTILTFSMKAAIVIAMLVLVASSVFGLFCFATSCKKVEYNCKYIVLRNDSIISEADGPNISITENDLCIGTLVRIDTTSKGIAKYYLYCQ